MIEIVACTAFVGTHQIASGDLLEVALKAKAAMEHDRWAQVLVFDDTTGDLVDLDFTATPDQIVNAIERQTALRARPAENNGESRRPGRPKLGVVAREVTLLPRHWEWLASQPGGASVALRKLVEQARKSNQGKDRRRRAQEAAYRFMSAMAGNAPGFEEAIRALFAGDQNVFEECVARWPDDVRKHAKRFANRAFEAVEESECSQK